MRRTKIVLIVLLGGIMLSLCVLLGIGISTGRGFWNGFGVHGGSDVGNKDAGSIDVGRIDVGRSVTGDFSVGDMDDADDMDDMHDVDSQGWRRRSMHSGRSWIPWCWRRRFRRKTSAA